MDDFQIRYRTPEEYDKEQEERKFDTSWNMIHEFSNGYLWHRYSDDVKIYRYDLEKRDIEYRDFPNLPPDQIEKIVAEISEENRIKSEYLKNNPIKIGGFSNTNVPKVSKNYPSMCINDIVGVQPMIERDNDER